MLQAMLTGNLGRKPEIKTTGNGDPYAVFSVACNVWQKGQKETVWVNVSCFDTKKVEFLQNYADKGSKVFIRGEVKARGYTTKDGQPGVSLDVTIGRFNGDLEMFGGGEASANQGQASKPPTNPNAGLDDLDDEVPF